MEEDITLSSLQAPLEKIIDNYPDDPDADGALDEIFRLAKEFGIRSVTVIRAYRVVRDLREGRKS